ncbi:four-carbon acid sugar kinase family protein [Enterobacter sp. DTU_2021_1002640_1_SI_PRY_ASU_LCPMC_013]|uniref:D-threonate kinase n=1 Tax=Enterobacter sp. DTU_2021_1002640_1_SI_PRY_ASU_LCPMC_013 TaxID=3077940 RepID=UPI0028EC2CC3|nr:four-carbon acid sugar kinase family protein [Enterobacter sp. DTU_2021_1002640_1_SI_PRY_ASU_LCPMC_013]WNU99053.1 four-carbon acid sugar kinase family protein [Enterobacter sp. DTU_2021_1002640_1_SI_PRY_ASU_LCPMC_013]
MNRLNSDQTVLIMADDFTGANDAGVSLALAGLSAEVALDAEYKSDAQALILNSDSRALPGHQAASRVMQMMQSVLRQHSPAWMVKKIDSTLRGNPGEEVMAMQRVTGSPAVIVAPAFPAAGRITLGGRCLVNGVVLTETEFASDPRTPVVSENIAELFSGNCRNIQPRELPAALAVGTSAFPAVLIVDAQTDDDLDEIIRHATQARDKPLLVGSAGLCEALARRLVPEKHPAGLAVVGSMSEIAQKQLAYAVQHTRCEQVFIDINDIFESSAAHYQETIITALNRGDHCLVYTSQDALARHRVTAVCERWGISRAECGERICEFLGALTRDVLRRSAPDGIYLSGGDVAIAVARALGARGFQIHGRVAGCVPWGYFSGCEWQRPVMTRAGGFGDETTLLKVLHFIEEKTGE